MENAIVSLFCLAIFLGGTMNLALTSLSVVEKVSSSWKQAEEQRYDIRQTEITVVGAAMSGDDQAEITIRNGGALSLGDFDRWDVIVRYQDGPAVWLPYESAPGWAVGSIYFEGSPEVFEPDILNPSEEVLLILSLDPPLPTGSAAEVTISTPGGVTARAMFTGE